MQDRPMVLFVWGKKRVYPVRITGMTVDLQIEQSRLRPSPATDSDDGNRLTPPGTATLTLQTIIRVPPGQGTLISGAQRVNADTKQLQTHVIVRATTRD